MKHAYHNMKTMDYSKDKKHHKSNVADYDPNVGENQTHFVGNSEGGRSEMTYDTVGVADGLGSLEMAEVKNAETVTQSQRPHGRTESSGEFTLGV